MVLAEHHSQRGKPPIWAFCVIVALFGALLGPGLLYFTGRMERRSLMIFLVPTISLLATVAVIAYGIFHEGFDTHVRLFSVTAYDGPSKTRLLGHAKTTSVECHRATGSNSLKTLLCARST